MTVTKTLGNYAKTLLATLTGDQSEKLALHNERRAGSALTRQISSLIDRKTTLQEKVENAEENLNMGKYPTYKLEESSNYCADIKRFQDLLDKAKQDLEDCEASIKYFTDLKSELSL